MNPSRTHWEKVYFFLVATLSFFHAAGSVFRYFQSVNWCNLPCQTLPTEWVPHVACLLDGDCLNISEPCKFETLDKQQIVDVHNRLRNKFATGGDPKTWGLTVSNMMQLQWDEGLEFTAHCNLKSCPVKMVHDRCHITEQFTTAGQNLAWSWSSQSMDCVNDTTKMVESWYDETRSATLSELKHQSQSFYYNGNTGHFTQLAWATVTHVGCALYSRISEGETCMLACNYGPAGNLLGQSMFREGPPASACPEGVGPSGEYPGLCDGATWLRNPPGLLLCLVVIALKL